MTTGEKRLVVFFAQKKVGFPILLMINALIQKAELKT